MIPRHISNATTKFSAPPDWNEERDGPCLDLWVRIVDGNCCESAWEPSPEELAILNAGGSIVLRVVGGQPPVWLTAEPQQ